MPHSHLPYPKYTYTVPAVFNPKSTPHSHLPYQSIPIQKQQISNKNYAISHLLYPKYTYTNLAVFNPKTTPKSHLT
jgi:hypothetical protein